MSTGFQGDPMLTVGEAAALFGVTAPTMRRWMREGVVPAHKLGPRRWMAYRSDLEALLVDHADAYSSETPRRGRPRQSAPVGAAPGSLASTDEPEARPLMSWGQRVSSHLIGDDE